MDYLATKKWAKQMSPLLFIEGSGHTLLHEACLANDLEFVRELVEFAKTSPCPPYRLDQSTYENDRPLSIAIKQKNIELAKYLYEQGADAMARCRTGQTALQMGTQCLALLTFATFIFDFLLPAEIDHDLQELVRLFCRGAKLTTEESFDDGLSMFSTWLDS